MRIALISDIHGNAIALDAVLADITAQGGVDTYWILGDFSSMGYDPVGVLERVTKLSNTVFTRGNHDRYTVEGERPVPTNTQNNPQLQLLVQALQANMHWTRDRVLNGGWWDWFTQLPLEARLTLPDGTRMLGVHAAPGLDDGPGIIPLLSDDELRTLLAPAEADLVIVGHTHVPLDRTVDAVRVVNLGSVSNPIKPRLAASYALLEADTGGYTVQMRYVDYDRQAVIKELQRVGQPAADFITRFLQGEMTAPWANRKTTPANESRH